MQRVPVFHTLIPHVVCVTFCPCERGVMRLLYKVCKLRELPIFTFVNKMDRPSLSPFELVDQIEREFGMRMAPVLWPIGDGEQFKVRAQTKCLEISYFGYVDPAFSAVPCILVCCDSSLERKALLCIASRTSRRLT